MLHFGSFHGNERSQINIVTWTTTLTRHLVLVYILMLLYMYIAPGHGQTAPWRQNFDDNRKAFSLWSYIASIKMISSKSEFIHIFNDFIHVYSSGGKARKPLGDRLLMSTEIPYHFDHLLQVSNKSL